MADIGSVDTSSYPKAPLPVQSPLAVASQINNFQQQNLAISQAQLDQANQGFTYLTRAMSSLGPNATKDQYKEVGANAVKLGLVPQNMLNVWDERVDAAPDSPTFFNQVTNAVQSHQQILQNYKGTPSSTSDNANIYQGVQGGLSSPNPGGFIPVTQAPIQLSPSQPIPGGPAGTTPGVVGAPPAGVRPSLPVAGPVAVPVRQGLPVQQAAATAPAPVSANPRPLPVAAPTTGATGPTTDITAKVPTEFNNRFNAAFPNAIATGPAPGVAEAQESVGKQSGTDYATDLTRAKNLQTDLYPMHRVLDILNEEGPKAFGPGTQGLNAVKSALVTWLPNVDQKTIDGVSNFEQAKKYLVQAARTAGNTGTNDQLAAAFEANPNVGMSGATIENVVKSNIALRKMQNAQTLLFGQQGLPASEYSQWVAKNQNVLDPRAFGFDMMTPEAKTKLMDGIATKDNAGNFVAKKGKEKDFNKFEQSLSFANDAGLIAPPGRKQ
jgi:hypothetical protein